MNENRNEIERRLRNAVDHAAPNDLDAVLDAPRMDGGTPWPVQTRRRSLRWLPMAAAAVLALLAFVGFRDWQNGHTVASVVSLDVNPSIQMQVNRKEQVLSADPLNKEGWEVLEGMDLQGTPLTLAVNAIVGSMLQHGYFEDAGAAILVSVEDQDTQRAQRLENLLNSSIGAALQNAVVHSQVVTYDAGLEPADLNSGLSVGKTALIQDIQALNGSLDFQGLAALSVEELWQLRQAGAPGMPIGLGNAAGIAEEYAGTLELSSTTWEAEPELDENPACYEIELSVYGLGKFDYKVDPYSGEILEGLPDVLRISMPQDVSEGSSGQVPVPPADTNLPANPNLPADTNPPAGIAGPIGQADAEAIAYAHAGVQAADVYGLEIELDDGVYELEFWAGLTEYEYEISARDGSILKAEHDASDEYGHHGETHRHGSGCISADDARSAALHHAGVSNPSGYQCEADWDDGRCVYEIEFDCNGVEYEYEIDGQTGAVLKAEQDR